MRPIPDDDPRWQRRVTPWQGTNPLLGCFRAEDRPLALPSPGRGVRCRDFPLGHRYMSRFLKNATFPILIVVVLAFFAQRFLGQDEEKPKPNFGQFLTQVENGQVKSVTIKTRDNTAQRHRRSTARPSTRPATRTTTSRG